MKWDCAVMALHFRSTTIFQDVHQMVKCGAAVKLYHQVSLQNGISGHEVKSQKTNCPAQHAVNFAGATVSHQKCFSQLQDQCPYPLVMIQPVRLATPHHAPVEETCHAVLSIKGIPHQSFALLSKSNSHFALLSALSWTTSRTASSNLQVLNYLTIEQDDLLHHVTS